MTDGASEATALVRDVEEGQNHHWLILGFPLGLFAIALASVAISKQVASRQAEIEVFVDNQREYRPGDTVAGRLKLMVKPRQQSAKLDVGLVTRNDSKRPKRTRTNIHDWPNGMARWQTSEKSVSYAASTAHE